MKGRENKRFLKTEAGVFLALYVVAMAFNAYAIVHSGLEWTETFKQLHVSLYIAFFMYVGIGLIRLLLRFYTISVTSFDKFSKPEDF